MTHQYFFGPARQMWLGLAITVGLAGGLTGLLSAPVWAVEYTDTTGHWASQDIDALTDRGVIPGYRDGTFRPNEPMTRSEFVMAFTKAYNLTSAGSSGLPTLKALNTTGAPNTPVTRAEVLAVTAEALAVPAGVGVARVNKSVESFSDTQAVPEWAVGGINRTLAFGVYVPSPDQPNMIGPMQPATRAEVAAILANMIEYNQSVASINTGVDQAPEGILATGLFSRYNKVGDPVTVVMRQTAITPGGNMMTPGTKMYGEVIEVEKATGSQSAKLGFRLTRAVTPNDQVYDINATMNTNNGVISTGEFREVVTPVPERSFEGLKAEVRSTMSAGPSDIVNLKMNVYDDALTTVAPYTADLLQTAHSDKDIYMGVGDRLKLRFDTPGAAQESNMPTETSEPTEP